jgi:hypothetical protein
MQKIDFLKNLVDFSKTENFSFLSPDLHIEDPKRMSGSKQSLVAAMVGFCGGALLASGVGYSTQKKEDLTRDLRQMSGYCDLIGIKLDTGPAIVRMVIDGDDMSGETLVGRFAMIHEKGNVFRKYSMVVNPNWILGDQTAGTFLQVLTVFSSHKSARDFTQTYAEKCIHRTLGLVTNRGGLFATYPWIIDLEDEDVTPVGIKCLGMLSRTGLFSAKYKTAFFQKSMIQP